MPEASAATAVESNAMMPKALAVQANADRRRNDTLPPGQFGCGGRCGAPSDVLTPVVFLFLDVSPSRWPEAVRPWRRYCARRGAGTGKPTRF
jgi:hypothetical protein